MGGKQNSKKLTCLDCDYYHFSHYCIHKDKSAYFSDSACKDITRRNNK